MQVKSGLTNCPGIRALFERSQNAAVVAALARAEASRARRLLIHPPAALFINLAELARRRSEEAAQAAHYERVCERELVSHLMGSRL